MQTLIDAINPSKYSQYDISHMLLLQPPARVTLLFCEAVIYLHM